MSARQHDHILASARELLGDVGYGATTMEGIAARAAVGKPTLYRWWPNRAALVHEAILDGAIGASVPDTGSLAGDVRAFVEGTVAFFDRPLVREAWLGAVVELRDDGAALANAHARFLRPAAGAFRRRLQAAVERGECRPDVEPSVVLDTVLGACMAALIVPGRRPPRARRVDALVGLVLRGLTAE